MPEHLHPDALAVAYIAEGPGPVRSLLAATGAPDLRAALLADAAARAQVAIDATSSTARAARRILDPPGAD